MPAFHSAAISTRMLQELGGATVIGPLIVGLEKPVQIVSLGAKDFRHCEHGRHGQLQYWRMTGVHAPSLIQVRLSSSRPAKNAF